MKRDLCKTNLRAFVAESLYDEDMDGETDRLYIVAPDFDKAMGRALQIFGVNLKSVRVLAGGVELVGMPE